jgi:subtilisin family serine protease
VSDPKWEDIAKPQIRDQVKYIWSEFRQDGAAGKLGERGSKDDGSGGVEVGVQISGGGMGFMYAEGQILVREGYLGRVAQILAGKEIQQGHVPTDQKLGAWAADKPKPVEPLIDGVVVLHFERQRDGNFPSVLDALNRIDGVLGPGYATPNHVLTVAGNAGPCPATEPEVVYDGIEPYPSVCPGDVGAGISIYVADTGLLWYPGDLPSAPALGDVVTDQGTVHPWLTGVRGKLDKKEDLTGATIKPYEAHGTFVAGVARCMAPGAEIFVANAFKVAGSTLETDLARHLDNALAHGYSLFHLSVTAPTRKDLPLLSFQGWLRRMHQHKGVACVVAAGNSGSPLPTWPAAFPEVVSVGALAADWRSRALFSNYGPWVDVYAPGRDLINAFATGTYTCYTAPYGSMRPSGQPSGQVRKFYGMAKWSGTSFSTPLVTGLIAARMSRTGENGKEAAAALLAEARAQAIPGVGAILLPCCNDRAWPVR